MKNLKKILPILMCLALVFGFASCADDYEPVDEKGISFMTLTANLSDEIAVPSGSVSVTYGASRNGTDTVNASLSSDGKTATAKLDEYFASSSGKFSKLSFSVKKADGTEVAVKAEKSSIKFDKDGASVSLSAKSTSTSETEKSDENADTTKTEETKTDENSENKNSDDDSNSQNTTDDENNEEDDELSPYLPEEFKNKAKSAVYTFFDETASTYSKISDVSPKDMEDTPQGTVYAFFFFSDETFLMTEKNFFLDKSVLTGKVTVDITCVQLAKGTYSGSPTQNGEIALAIDKVNTDNEDDGADWDEETEAYLSADNKSCTVTVSNDSFVITVENTFIEDIRDSCSEYTEWTFKRQ